MLDSYFILKKGLTGTQRKGLKGYQLKLIEACHWCFVSWLARKRMRTNTALQSHHRFTNMHVKDCALSRSDVF